MIYTLISRIYVRDNEDDIAELGQRLGTFKKRFLDDPDTVEWTILRDCKDSRAFTVIEKFFGRSFYLCEEPFLGATFGPMISDYLERPMETVKYQEVDCVDSVANVVVRQLTPPPQPKEPDDPWANVDSMLIMDDWPKSYEEVLYYHNTKNNTYGALLDQFEKENREAAEEMVGHCTEEAAKMHISKAGENIGAGTQEAESKSLV